MRKNTHENFNLDDMASDLGLLKMIIDIDVGITNQVRREYLTIALCQLITHKFL